MRFQWPRGRAALRPPFEPTGGKPLLRKPVPLSVVTQCPQRRSTPVDEKKKTARERILDQLFPTQLGQRVDTFSAVNRIDGHQNAHLWCNLQHRHLPREVPYDGGQARWRDVLHENAHAGAA